MTRTHGLAPYALSVAITCVMLPYAGLAAPPLFDTQTLCQPIEVHEGEPDEKACLKEFSASVRRDRGRLTLGLANGKTKVISDAKECDDPNQEASCTTYRLVGHLGEQYYLVLVAPYECAYMMLVNRKSGAQTELGGWPRLSPDKTHFAVIDPQRRGRMRPGLCDRNLHPDKWLPAA